MRMQLILGLLTLSLAGCSVINKVDEQPAESDVGFLAEYLTRLQARLRELGARRIRRGNAWYWELKPDLKPGEVFTL